MIPRKLFIKEDTQTQSVENEGQVFHLTEKIEFENEGGIRQYFKGGEYPIKGLASPSIVADLNIIKRLFVESIKLGQKMVFLPSPSLIGIFGHKRQLRAIGSILEAFNQVSKKVLAADYLKPKHLLPSSKEIYYLTYNFLTKFGFSEVMATDTANTIACFIEFDSAYRLRLQDLFHASNKKDFIKSPIRELKRFNQLLKERDSKEVSSKFERIFNILCLILLLSRFRKAFRYAFEKSIFENLQFDEADIYYISMRNDYNYLGEDVETRSKRNEGKKIPIPVNKIEYEKMREESKTKCVLIPQDHWKKIEAFLTANKFEL
jgi:hypothetical protein